MFMVRNIISGGASASPNYCRSDFIIIFAQTLTWPFFQCCYALWLAAALSKCQSTKSCCRALEGHSDSPALPHRVRRGRMDGCVIYTVNASGSSRWITEVLLSMTWLLRASVWWCHIKPQRFPFQYIEIGWGKPWLNVKQVFPLLHPLLWERSCQEWEHQWNHL